MPRIIPYHDGNSEGVRVNFRDQKGRQHQLRFSTKRYNDPEAAAREYIARVCDFGMAGHRQSLSDDINRYLSWCERTHKKQASTLCADRGRLNTILRWCIDNGVNHLDELTVERFRSFMMYFFDNYPLYTNKARMRRAGSAPKGTWEKYRLILSALFVWAIEKGIVTQNPAARKEFKRQPENNDVWRYIQPSDAKRFLEAIDERGPIQASVMFRLLLHTGMRISEAIRLRWEDIDFDKLQLRLTKTKTGKIVHVPISAPDNEDDRRNPDDFLVSWLMRLPQDTDLVFAQNGERFAGSRAWYRRLRAALETSGIGPARLHDLRHTFVSSLIEAGVDIVTVGKIVGHRRVQTTLRYSHISDAHLRDAIRKLPR